MPMITQNFGLKKPLQTDFYNVADFNENFEIIDQVVGQVKGSVDMLVASNGGFTIDVVTLKANGWAGTSGAFIQTVEAKHVVADETKQIILPIAKSSSMNAYDNYQIKATAQGDKTLTFTAKCDDIPTTDVVVFIATTGVS